MPRRPEQNKEIRERTKRQIIDAGLRIFSQKGYHGASIADIAKEAGVSKGLAYNYFSGKKELAEAVILTLEEVFAEFEILFRKIDDPYEILRQSIKETIKNTKENEEFWRLYMGLITQLEMGDLARETLGKIIEKYIKKFTAVFRKIGVKNPKAEAYLFGSILDGVPMDYLFDKEHYPLKSVEKILLEKYGKENLTKRL